MRVRLQLCLDREEEARSETRLVRLLREYGISFVTPGIVGDERNREGASEILLDGARRGLFARYGQAAARRG